MPKRLKIAFVTQLICKNPIIHPKLFVYSMLPKKAQNQKTLYQTVYLDMKILNIVKTLGNIVVVLKKTVFEV